MFRPERMISASVICVKQDVESVLEALSSFGEFQIEKATKENTTGLEYGQLIQKAEESLTNVRGLIKQLSQTKGSLLDMFKTVTPTKLEVTAENWQSLSEETSQQIATLKKEVDSLNTSLSGVQGKIFQLNSIRDILTTMEKMDVDLDALQNLKLIHAIVASVPHKSFDDFAKALGKFPIFLNRAALTKDTDFVSIAVPSKFSEEVNKILKSHRAEVFAIPKDLPHNLTDALKEVNSQLENNSKQEKEILDSLKKLGQENNHKLASWKETTENILAQLNAKKKMLESNRLAVVSGFIPKKRFTALNEKVHTILGEKAIVLKNELEKAQVPPTSIKNNRFVKPFETITNLYGLPYYNEIDPTPFIAITFPILFGLMFGDIGHGAILLIGGFAIAMLLKNNKGFRNLGYIIGFCGIAAIVAGALFGEFFGHQIFTPIWFDPFSGANVFNFLLFSLIIGVIQITSGLVLEMVNFLVRRDVADAILLSLPKIAFYLGAVYVIIVYGLNISAWLSGPILIFLVPVILMMIAKPTYVTLTQRSRSAKSQSEHETKKEEGSSFGERIFDSGDTVIRLLSNSISYSRILALLMTHWALLFAVSVIASMVGPVFGILIIVLGNVLVIVLEAVIVFIHTLRLHFYEWFSKFYQDNGKPFQPFKQNFIYTKIKFMKKNV